MSILNRKRVFEYAAEHHIPALYEYDFLVRDGGLMSYGPDLKESLERAGALAARILNGERPADLPFEEPTHYPLVINLKTAEHRHRAVPEFLGPRRRSDRIERTECPLLIQSGHSILRIVATQNDGRTPFR